MLSCFDAQSQALKAQIVMMISFQPFYEHCGKSEFPEQSLKASGFRLVDLKRDLVERIHTQAFAAKPSESCY